MIVQILANIEHFKVGFLARNHTLNGSSDKADQSGPAA